jgi:uncharacterized protein (TIGR02099 family)
MLLRKLGRALIVGVAGFLILVLLALVAAKLALDRVPAYQNDIKAWVHRQTGLYVRFAHVSPTLRWYGPELYFERIELRSKDDKRVLARAAGGRIGMDVRQLVRSGKLFAGRVQLDAPDIVIARLGPSSFALASEIALQGEGNAAAALTLDDLPAGMIAIRGGRLTLRNWNESLPELVLGDVNLELLREADRITVTLAAHLPPSLGGALVVTGGAQGLGDLSSLAWSLNLRPRDIDFSGWRRLLPEYLGSLAGGHGGFALRADGIGALVKHADLDFAAADVETRLGERLPAKFDQIGGAVSLLHAGDRWSLAGRRMYASRGGRQDPSAQFDVSWRVADEGLLELHAGASYLRAEGLLPLVGLLPQKDLRDRLLALAPTGEWQDAQLDLDRGRPGDPWHLRVAAKFRDAGLAPMLRAPGLRGLSGEIAGTESGGSVRLEMHGGQINWPRQWPQPITVERASGNFYWSRSDAGLLVATPGLEIKTPDALLQAQVALQLPNAGDSPNLTLVSRIDNGNVTHTRDYLPRDNLPPKTLEWLDRALVAGHLTHADILLRGPLRHFPFRDGSGLFLARAALEGVTIDYQNGWPPVTDLVGRVEFRNVGMSAAIYKGRADTLELTEGEALFPDFKSGEFSFHALAAGSAEGALAFLRATPLDAQTGQTFSNVEAQGPFQSKIDVYLPFRDLTRRRILVAATLDGDSLTKPGLPLTASDVTGDFAIENGQLSHADLRGKLLGGPFHAIAHAPRPRPLNRSQLDVRGMLSGEALRAALSLPAATPIQGQSDWHAVVKLAPEPARERSVHVTGSLAGLDLELPQPLHKPPGVPLPTTLDIQWPSAGGTQISLAMGSLLRGVGLLEADPKGGTRLAHAAIGFGDSDPVISDSQIVSVGGRLGHLDLTGWLRSIPAERGGRPLSAYLHSAKLEIDAVDFIGLVFRQVGVDLLATGEHWRVRVESPNLAGTITWPAAADSAEPWELAFQRVKVDEGMLGSPPGATAGEAAPGEAAAGAAAAGAAAAGDPAARSVSPRSVPALDFAADDLNWLGWHVGSVHAVLGKHDDGVTLDALTTLSPSFKIDAHGGWRGRDPGVGRISGALTSTDVKATLTQLGYADVISAKSGHVDFDLSWVGAPTADALREMTGHVQVAMEKGALLGVKPGAGRVLGLASIAALPRRLALDFSDLTDKGLAFDTAHGNFEFRGGNAYTDDSVIKGPAAEIGIIGRVGIKAKDYDQTAEVTGSISNTLPIAGALAGGPVVGAAVLLFTQVFKQPLNGLTRAYYRISGGWDNPTVERISSAGAAASGAEVPK